MTLFFSGFLYYLQYFWLNIACAWDRRPMRVIIRCLVDIAFSLHVVHTGLSYILIFRLTYYLLFCLLFRVYFPPLYPIIACMNQSILSKLQSAYRGDEDFRMRNITCGEGKFVVVNLDTMTDHVKVSQFVLQPLVEIAPDLVHPVLKKKMLELLWKNKVHIPLQTSILPGDIGNYFLYYISASFVRY